MDPSEGTPAAGGMKSALARLAASLVAMVRTRAELAGIEIAEERERLLVRLAFLFGGVLLVASAVLLVGVFVILLAPEAHRLLAIALVAVAYALLGGGLIVKAKAIGRDAPAPFAATLGELEKDRLRLQRSAQDVAGGNP